MSKVPEQQLSLTAQSTWLFGAKIVSFGLSILLPLLTVRFLAQDKVGEYRQAFMFVTNAAVLLPFGFSMSAYYYLNREGAKHGSVIFNILIFNFVMGGTAFLVLLVRPELLGSLFGNAELTRLAPSIGFLILLWIFSGFLEVAALANREARLATFFIIVAQFTKTVLMAGAVIIYATVEAFIYAAIAQGILQTVVLLTYLNRRFPRFWGNFDWRSFRAQLRYAIPFGIAALLYTSNTDIHNYFVSHRFGPSEFAIYSQGCFELPLIAILYESISSVIIPKMSRLQEEGRTREMLMITVSAAQKLALAYFPLFIFLMIVAHEFITTLFTKEYAASVPIFRINIILIPFFCLIADPIGRAFQEVGTFLLKARAVIFVCLIFALWFGVNNFGLTGMISIVVVTVLVERAVSVWKTLSILGVGRSHAHLLTGIRKTAVAAALAGIMLFVFHLATSSFLLDAFITLWRSALVGFGLEKAADFFGGCSYLAACLAVYLLAYLPIAVGSGAVEDSDRERVLNLFRGITRWFRSKAQPSPVANGS